MTLDTLEKAAAGASDLERYATVFEARALKDYAAERKAQGDAQMKLATDHRDKATAIRALLLTISKTGKAPVVRLKPTEDTDGFARFWSRYPRKIAKANARAMWLKWKCEPFTDKILAALDAACASPDWRKEAGTFIPYPATWLNREGWEDDFTAPKKAAAPKDERWEEFLRELNQPLVPKSGAPDFLLTRFADWKA